METVNTGALNGRLWGVGHDGAEAFLVGGNIASMAAAFMIRDGDMLGRGIISHFMPRGRSDRPQVFSPGAGNPSLIGQFVKLRQDAVFTVKYSVHSAQVTVQGLLSPQREVRANYQGRPNPRVLLKAIQALHDVRA